VSVVKSQVTLSGVVKVNEAELRALDALVGYGVKPFLAVFYEKMGRHYLEPHEAGLRSLFETIRAQVPNQLAQVDMARKFLKDQAP